jgi:hypothetical protein
MNPKAKGEVTEGMIIARLLQLGEIVLMPFGDNQRFDLVVYRGDKFIRIQCKTGRLGQGGEVIIFNTCSSHVHRGHGKSDYSGEIDVFAVYSPELKRCYWIPIEKVQSKRSASLRLIAPTGQMKKNCKMRWAKEFEL